VVAASIAYQAWQNDRSVFWRQPESQDLTITQFVSRDHGGQPTWTNGFLACDDRNSRKTDITQPLNVDNIASRAVGPSNRPFPDAENEKRRKNWKKQILCARKQKMVSLPSRSF
jgi:hypothetical protein